MANASFNIKYICKAVGPHITTDTFGDLLGITAVLNTPLPTGTRVMFKTDTSYKLGILTDEDNGNYQCEYITLTSSINGVHEDNIGSLIFAIRFSTTKTQSDHGTLSTLVVNNITYKENCSSAKELADKEFMVLECYPTFGYNFMTGKHNNDTLPTETDCLKIGRVITNTNGDEISEFTVTNIDNIYTTGKITIKPKDDDTEKDIDILDTDSNYSIVDTNSPPSALELSPTPPVFDSTYISNVIKKFKPDSSGINISFKDKIPLGTRVIFNDTNDVKIGVLTSIDETNNTFKCKYISNSSSLVESRLQIIGNQVGGAISESAAITFQKDCSKRDELNVNKFMVIEYYPTFGYKFENGEHKSQPNEENCLNINKHISRKDSNGTITNYIIKSIDDIYTKGLIILSPKPEEGGEDEEGGDGDGPKTVVHKTVAQEGGAGEGDTVNIKCHILNTDGEYSIPSHNNSGQSGQSGLVRSGQTRPGQSGLVRSAQPIKGAHCNFQEKFGENTLLANLFSTNLKKHISIKDIKRGTIRLNNVTSYFATHQTEFFSHNSDSNLLTDNHTKFNLTLSMNYNDIENEDDFKKVIVKYIAQQLKLESSSIHIDSLERGSVIVRVTLNTAESKSFLNTNLKEVVYLNKRRRVSEIKVIEIKSDNPNIHQINDSISQNRRVVEIPRGSPGQGSRHDSGNRQGPVNDQVNGSHRSNVPKSTLEQNPDNYHNYGVLVTTKTILKDISKICGTYFRKVLFNYIVQQPLNASKAKTVDGTIAERGITPDPGYNSNTDFTNLTTLYNHPHQGANGHSFGGEQWMWCVTNLLGCPHYFLDQNVGAYIRKIEENKYEYSHAILPLKDNQAICETGIGNKILLANVSRAHWQYCVETDKTDKTTEIIASESRDFEHIAHISRIIDSGGDGNCYYNSIALYILYNVLDSIKDLPDQDKDAKLTDIHKGDKDAILEKFKEIIANQIRTKLNIKKNICEGDYKIDEKLTNDVTDAITKKYKGDLLMVGLKEGFHPIELAQQDVKKKIDETIPKIEPSTSTDDIQFVIVRFIHKIRNETIIKSISDFDTQLNSAFPNIRQSITPKIAEHMESFNNQSVNIDTMMSILDSPDINQDLKQEFVREIIVEIKRQVKMDKPETLKTYVVLKKRINALMQDGSDLCKSLTGNNRVNMKAIFKAVTSTDFADVDNDMTVTRTKISEESYNSYLKMVICSDDFSKYKVEVVGSGHKANADFMKWEHGGCFVNFANANAKGGGYCNGDWAQEEQMLGLNPVSAIFTLDNPLGNDTQSQSHIGRLGSGEIIQMTDVTMDYEVLRGGYKVDDTEQWVNDIRSGNPNSILLRRNRKVVNIYAIDFQRLKKDQQYTLPQLKFCFHKSLSMMCKARESGHEIITTGLIGAGVFNGSPCISLLIQILAANLVGIELIFTNVHDDLKTRYNATIDILLPEESHDLTVNQLLKKLVDNPYFHTKDK
jgi:hypothetical protein